MAKLGAEELLSIIKFQWADTKDIMKIGSVGEVRARKIKSEISQRIDAGGDVLPKNLVPMDEVIAYFKININYLKKVVGEEIKKNDWE